MSKQVGPNYESGGLKYSKEDDGHLKRLTLIHIERNLNLKDEIDILEYKLAREKRINRELRHFLIFIGLLTCVLIAYNIFHDIGRTKKRTNP